MFGTSKRPRLQVVESQVESRSTWGKEKNPQKNTHVVDYVFFLLPKRFFFGGTFYFWTDSQGKHGFVAPFLGGTDSSS